MKLSEIFQQLAFGELSQMAVVNSTGDGIDPTKYAQMVAHVNLGLMALYKRFHLKESRTIIELVPDITTYVLSTSGDTVFQEDANTPDFTDDILKITQVYTSGETELDLNDAANGYSCFTPSATVLRVPLDIVNQSADLPDELITDTLTVVYRASHPVITYRTNFNPSAVNLELPMTHLDPLLLFIASRMNNPIGMTNEFHAGNSYAAKFEQACALLEAHNLQVDQGAQNTRLQRSGWV